MEIYKFEAGSLDIASFKPFFVNGKLNVFIQGNRKWPGKKNVSRDYTSENCYVCFADRNMFGTDLFAKPYHSYAELLIENQEKFGEFFPDTFDWDSHIGNFSFSEKSEEKTLHKYKILSEKGSVADRKETKMITFNRDCL